MSHVRPVFSRRLVATVASAALLLGAAAPGQAVAGPKTGTGTTSGTSTTTTTTTDSTTFKTDGRKNR